MSVYLKKYFKQIPFDVSMPLPCFPTLQTSIQVSGKYLEFLAKQHFQVVLRLEATCPSLKSDFLKNHLGQIFQEK